MELSGLNKLNKPEHRWKFQGQEEQKEFGLNWSSFKYRNADVALGRFFSVDPLAEDYLYNSTYAFSENKVTADFELEGLESRPARTGRRATRGTQSRRTYSEYNPNSGLSHQTVQRLYRIFPSLARGRRGSGRGRRISSSQAAGIGQTAAVAGLVFNILKSQVDAQGARNALENLSKEDRDEFLILDTKGVQNMTSSELSRYRQLENAVRGKGSSKTYHSHKSNNGLAMFAEQEDDMVGGMFKHTNGEVTEFLADRKVIGNTVEYTDIAFYPKDAKGNEKKNELGGREMLRVFQVIKEFAKSQGYGKVRIHFIRGKGSSSAKPGKVFDDTFDLK